MNLKKAISEISELLEILFQDREKILKLSREIIRNCSIAIKNVHRKEFDKFQEKVNHIKINHQSLVKLVNTNPGVFFKYLKTPEQEYAESIIFYSIISKNNIPTPLELKISKICIG